MKENLLEIQVFYFGEGLDKLKLFRLLIDWFY